MCVGHEVTLGARCDYPRSLKSLFIFFKISHGINRWNRRIMAIWLIRILAIELTRWFWQCATTTSTNHILLNGCVVWFIPILERRHARIVIYVRRSHVRTTEIVFGTLPIYIFGRRTLFTDIINQFLSILYHVLNVVHFRRLIKVLRAFTHRIIET